MRQKTEHKVSISICELESLLSKMKEHRENNSDLSTSATIDLDFDTDWGTLVISNGIGNAYQHSSYAECNGLKFTE